MTRLLVVLLVAALGAAILLRGPDEGPRSRFPDLPLAVLPGMMRSAVVPALQASAYTVDVRTPQRIEAISPDQRTRLTVVLARTGQVVSVASRRVADLAQVDQGERTFAGLAERAAWRRVPAGSADRRYVRGTREVLVRRLFECDSITPAECYYAVLEAHDRSRDPWRILRP